MTANSSSGKSNSPKSSGSKQDERRAASASNKRGSSGQSRPRKPAEPESSSSVSVVLWLIPVISVIFLIWMLVLEMGFVDTADLIGINNEQWFMLSVFVIICCIIVLILSVVGSLMSEAPGTAHKPASGSGRSDRTVIIEAVPDQSESKPEEKAAVKTESKAASASTVTEEVFTESVAGEEKIEKAAEKSKQVKEPEKAIDSTKDVAGQRMIEYPIKVGTGLYGDTYIKIDSARVLKLRTLLLEDYYLI